MLNPAGVPVCNSYFHEIAEWTVQSWAWGTKAYLFFFIVPIVAYCIYQLKYQEDAIRLDGNRLCFATMTPWGRSQIDLSDLESCEFEYRADEFDRLILTVSDACYQREKCAWTWVETGDDKLRFDMIYASPNSKSVSETIDRLVQQNFR